MQEGLGYGGAIPSPARHPLKITWTFWRGYFCGVSSDGLTSLESLGAFCSQCASRSPNEGAQCEQTNKKINYCSPALTFCLKTNPEELRRFKQELTWEQWCCWGRHLHLSGFWEVPSQVSTLPGWSEPSEEHGNCSFYFSSLPYISSLTTLAAATFYFFPLQLFQ